MLTVVGLSLSCCCSALCLHSLFLSQLPPPHSPFLALSLLLMHSFCQTRLVGKHTWDISTCDGPSTGFPVDVSMQDQASWVHGLRTAYSVIIEHPADLHNSYSSVIPVVKWSPQILVCLVGFQLFLFTAVIYCLLLPSCRTGNLKNPRPFRLP